MAQLVFLGAPGSGKGTQAKRLEQRGNYKHISTGDLLREEVASGSELGEKVNQILKRGELVDDLTVLEMLQKNCDLEKKIISLMDFPAILSRQRFWNKGY